MLPLVENPWSLGHPPWSLGQVPLLSADKEHFSQLAVDAVLRLKGSTNLDAIQILKKACAGGLLNPDPPNPKP